MPSCCMAGLALWGAGHNYGPFVQPSENVSTLLISTVGTSSLMTLLVVR